MQNDLLHFDSSPPPEPQTDLSVQAWLAITLNERFKPAQQRALFSADWFAGFNSETYPHPVDSRLLSQALETDRATEAKIEQALQWAEQENNHLLGFSDPRYPALLRTIPNPPLLLYVVGNPSWLNKPSLAIVGSRNASALGLQTAQQFAQELATLGLTIVSGLASGIDSAAHRGALVALNEYKQEPYVSKNLKSVGSTVAIVGTGVDLCYPPQHRRLNDLIQDNGCVVSELALGTPVRKHHFPQRNRIIAGLSLGLLVVEAAYESGSLITAQQALEMGREIFAIPNSIHSPVGKGCHHLIKNGAHLVEQIQDILTALPHQYGFSPAKNTSKNNKSRLAKDSTADSASSVTAANNRSEPIDSSGLHWLGYSPVSLETLISTSGEPMAIWFERLCDWELNGLVERTLDGQFVRKH